MEIRFTPEDVRRLYGARFFVLPGDEPGEGPSVGPEEKPARPIQNEEVAPEAEPETPATVQIEAIPEMPVREIPEMQERKIPEVPTKAIPEFQTQIPPEITTTPSVPKTQGQKTSPFTEGPEVIWKMRSTARLALVMVEEEFSNRAMTVVLKDCIQRAGINTDWVGFGMLKGSGSSWDFRKMPVGVAVIFRPFEGVSSPYPLESHLLHITYPVKEIVFDPAKQDQLISLLKSLTL